MMHVGLVIYGDLGNTSGGFLYDREIVEYLRERGDDVEVISLPWRTYRHHLRDNLSPDVYRQLRGPYDVLLQDELCHPSLLLPNRRLDQDYPTVSIVHSAKAAETRSSSWNWLFQEIERQYLRTVDGIVYNSRATAETVGRLVDAPGIIVPPGRGHCLPSVTADEIAARAYETPIRIVFVGNLIPRKGVDILVDGLARLPTREWRLTVIGSLESDRRYVAWLRQLIEQFGLEEAVTLTGRLPDPELADHLRRHHLLAMPSTYEAFGIVYLEGMGFGLPALATTAGGADEIVSDGENGFLVPPNDPRAIAERLEPVLDDRDRLREMSLAARETYEMHHSWTETGSRIRDFLQRLAGQKGDQP
ncbi:glycosyltransferase family 4 protein [Haladaptatus halobius]|uniref:glycosyltransferase family 4 protein n=1 Tax=Haladaptatus halobius TaxID=2884875 RepID=UPI001D09EE5E|nr:glycosyltransferase family 4 protein [Haladaptatus halobius]